MSNARKLADNLPTDGQLGNRNIIINGNFTISQRGSYTSSTSVSDGTFYLDRWQYVEDGSPSSSLIHNSDGSVKITTGASVTGSSRLRQKFEYSLAPRQYDNKTFTVSAKVKSNTANARINVYAGGYLSLTGTTAHSGGGSYETLTATFTTPSTISTEFSVHIGIDGASSANVSITSGQYFEVKEVQMEQGSQHTPFEHEPVGVTLSKCQRYFRLSNDGSEAYQAVGNGHGHAENTSSFQTDWVWHTEMRTKPTLAVFEEGNSLGSVFVRQDYSYFCDGVSLASGGKNGIRINLTSPNNNGGDTTFQDTLPGSVYASGTNKAWSADAEL